MGLFKRFKRFRRWLPPALAGTAAGLVGLWVAHSALEYTSTNGYCAGCHVHPQATESWKKGPHFKTASGMQVGCVACHLPPDGLDHYLEKARAGFRDLYAYYFEDHSQFDWEAKSVVDQAVHYTFDSACSGCHKELFPIQLSSKGVDAHLHYGKKKGELNCVNCHLGTGHFQEKPLPEPVMTEAPTAADEQAAPSADSLAPDEFADFTETIPTSGVRFTMIAIPGGRFRMGSPPDEENRRPQEGPQREVEISPFWMGKFEVSWQEYESFYADTATRGKNERGLKSDAVTGPTPPYGSPDQGWGKGRRPAITMTHYAALKYCQWLTSVTGRLYRLPTEAEWEYACRAGTTGRYPFPEGEPEKRGWLSWFRGTDRSQQLLASHAWYRTNSRLKTHSALETLRPNPWGLYNMLGNVKEFCLDYYRPDVLAGYPEGLLRDPRGPSQGEEHVVRGGSFKSGPDELRSAWREGTRQQDWLKTDPQTPKSVWWYSDNNDVGFRVVREFRAPPGQTKSQE